MHHVHRDALGHWLDGVIVRRRPHLWPDLRLGHPPRSPRPANDSWIAACGLTYGLPLATLDLKDYEDFAEHDGITLISQ